MRKRVLVVDDSAVVRRILSDLLEAEASLELAGVAPNGKIALRRIEELDPDLVILDIEMPEMDGLDVLREIRATRKELPVLVFSTVTERAGERTLDALALGANDYVTKPSGVVGAQVSLSQMRTDLLAKIHALLGRAKRRANAPPNEFARSEQPKMIPAPVRLGGAPPLIVAFGASTGGPNALAEIVPKLPSDFSTPVVIVQHMPPLFTAVFAERLKRESRLEVREARHGDRLEPGVVLVAPGDWHMKVSRGRVELDRGPHENCCRPAVDVLFRSVAEEYGAASLGVVLTGMGQDGCAGAQAIRKASGQMIVQDEASSVIWSMPGSIVAAGLANRVLSLDRIAGEIVSRVERRTAVSS
jgi:two-component system chemotaxis response regulator CheB